MSLPNAQRVVRWYGLLDAMDGRWSAPYSFATWWAAEAWARRHRKRGRTVLLVHVVPKVRLWEASS